MKGGAKKGPINDLTKNKGSTTQRKHKDKSGFQNDTIKLTHDSLVDFSLKWSEKVFHIIWVIYFRKLIFFGWFGILIF